MKNISYRTLPMVIEMLKKIFLVLLLNSFFKRITSSLNINFLTFFDIEPYIFPKLFLSVKCVASPEIQRNIFGYFFMFYLIISQTKS